MSSPVRVHCGSEANATGGFPSPGFTRPAEKFFNSSTRPPAAARERLMLVTSDQTHAAAHNARPARARFAFAVVSATGASNDIIW